MPHHSSSALHFPFQLLTALHQPGWAVSFLTQLFPQKPVTKANDPASFGLNTTALQEHSCWPMEWFWRALQGRSWALQLQGRTHRGQSQLSSDQTQILILKGNSAGRSPCKSIYVVQPLSSSLILQVQMRIPSAGFSVSPSSPALHGPPIPPPASPKARHEPRDTLSQDKPCQSFQPGLTIPTAPRPQLCSAQLGEDKEQVSWISNPHRKFQHRPLIPAAHQIHYRIYQIRTELLIFALLTFLAEKNKSTNI